MQAENTRLSFVCEAISSIGGGATQLRAALCDTRVPAREGKAFPTRVREAGQVPALSLVLDTCLHRALLCRKSVTLA